MKKIISILLTLILTTTYVYAEFYKVTVTRKDSDLYKIEYLTNTIYIVTRYCYEYVYYEDAVLKYDKYSYDNKLIFDSGATCEVDKLLTGD